MTRIGILTVLGVVLAIASMAPAAGLINGSFESGLTGWTTSTTGYGSVTAVTGFENWHPTDGTHFALLKTDAGFLWGGSTTPQLLYQTPDLCAGSVVSFDYFFDEDSLICHDIAKISLGGTTVVNVNSNAPSTEGNWVHFISNPFPVAGAYTIQFGVQDADGALQSALGVDNVVATCPVPEPLTMLAVLSGISGLGVYLRRRRA